MHMEMVCIKEKTQPKFTFSKLTMETPKKVGNLFKVNSKDNRMMSMTSF